MVRHTALALVLALGPACLVVDGDSADEEGGGYSPAPGNQGNEPDTWGTAAVAIETSDGATGSITDPDGADGPGTMVDGGGLMQAIVVVSAGLGEDFVDISLINSSSSTDGIAEGATCRVFAHLGESTDGCGWFTVGAGQIGGADGAEVFGTNTWDEVDGELQLTRLEADGEVIWVSFDFWADLAQGSATARIEGEVVDARLE